MTDHSFTRHLDALSADASPTAHLLDELQLYGYRPHQDEPDPRPLPDAETVQGALAEAFDALAAVFLDTRLEADLEGLLWGTVNLFHRKAERLQRDLDANERDQRRSQTEQDGSEVRSVELERLTAEGLGLIERRNAFEFCREQAGELFEARTGSSARYRELAGDGRRSGDGAATGYASAASLGAISATSFGRTPFAAAGMDYGTFAYVRGADRALTGQNLLRAVDDAKQLGFGATDKEAIRDHALIDYYSRDPRHANTALQDYERRKHQDAELDQLVRHARLTTTAIYAEVSGPEEQTFADGYRRWSEARAA